MKVKAAIDHLFTTEIANDDHREMAEFLFVKAAEWVAGRRGGKFTIAHDGTATSVWFSDITRFSVEVSQ